MKTKIIIIIASVFLLVSCWYFVHNKWNKADPATVQEDNPFKDADIKAVVIPLENHTFGYDIYVHGAVLVHQPTRPGLPGNSGFATDEDAMKVAELVIRKIRNNEMPPTVTIEELQVLGVLNNRIEKP